MRLRPASIASVCASALLTLSAAGAWASPVIYRGTDSAAGGNVHLDRAPAVERNKFLNALDPAGVRHESFELFTGGSAAPLSLFGAAATNLPTLAMPDPTIPTGSSGNIVAGDPVAGRFNTSGTTLRWWESSGDFSISFDVQIQAFAFFATDLGDFDGTLTIAWLLGTDIRGTESLSKAAGAADGTLDFWGVTDRRGFDEVRFTITQPANVTDSDDFDFVGFDDLIAGRLPTEPPPGNGVPEPLTLALVGLGLVGIALTRRRRA